MASLSWKAFRDQMKPSICLMEGFTLCLIWKIMLPSLKITSSWMLFQVFFEGHRITFQAIIIVNFLPELMKYIALDEISLWRPGWPEIFWKKIYFSNRISKEDRRIMKLVYNQVTKRLDSISKNELLCANRERQAASSWKSKFIDKAGDYGRQNGQYPAPLETIRKYFPEV